MSYKAIVTREGDNWLADVPELEGAHTYARSLTGLHQAVQEVIILAANLDDDATPDVTYRYDVDDPAVAQAAELGRLRAELAEREAAAQADTAHVIDALRANGYSVRDVAALVGLTPGRISQVEKPTPRRAARKRSTAGKKAAPLKAAPKFSGEPKRQAKALPAAAAAKPKHGAAARARRKVGL